MTTIARPSGPLGVDIFAEADELDLYMIEFVQDLEEVADGAGQAVESPDHDNLEPAMPGIGHQLVEAGALRLGAADLVGVLLDDLVTALLGQLAQVVKLRLRVLIEGGDAEVQGRALHLAALLRRFQGSRRVLADVVFDELQQDVGHVLAAGGGGRLEGVVQADVRR